MNKEKVEKVDKMCDNKIKAAVMILKEKLTQSGIKVDGKIITIKDNQVTVK